MGLGMAISQASTTLKRPPQRTPGKPCKWRESQARAALAHAKDSCHNRKSRQAEPSRQPRTCVVHQAVQLAVPLLVGRGKGTHRLKRGQVQRGSHLHLCPWVLSPEAQGGVGRNRVGLRVVNSSWARGVTQAARSGHTLGGLECARPQAMQRELDIWQHRPRCLLETCTALPAPS